jgi:hypothetical protein
VLAGGRWYPHSRVITTGPLTTGTLAAWRALPYYLNFTVLNPLYAGFFFVAFLVHSFLSGVHIFCLDAHLQPVPWKGHNPMG